jgi:aldose 1-epimerase
VDSAAVLDHVLKLESEEYLAVDETLIPTGELIKVHDGPMDFTTAKSIGKDLDQLKARGIRGYDHCYVLPGTAGELRLAARATDPNSGRSMQIHTTEPAIQFYSSNFLDGGEVNGGYQQHSALCLETQHYPDAPNQEKFPSTVLRPGEKFTSTTVHKFSVA